LVILGLWAWLQRWTDESLAAVGILSKLAVAVTNLGTLLIDAFRP